MIDRYQELLRKRWAGDITSDEQDELDRLTDLAQAGALRLDLERVEPDCHADDKLVGVFGFVRVSPQAPKRPS